MSCRDALLGGCVNHHYPPNAKSNAGQSGRRAPWELLDSQGGTGSSMSCGRLEVLVVKTGPKAQR